MRVVRMFFIAFDIIFCASAGFACKATSCFDESSPVFLPEVWQIFRHYVFPDQSTSKARIEAVSSPDCAYDVLDGWRLELVNRVWRANHDLFGSVRANEEGAILADTPIIYYARVARRKHYLEVVCTASHDGALSEVLQDGWCERLELVAVIAAAIAASENTSTDGFVVRSIKKVNRRNRQRG